MSDRLKSVLPYVAALVVCAALYGLTTEITYAERPGQLGPDFWPKVAIGLMAAVSLLEIVRLLIRGTSASTVGVAESLDRTSEEEASEEEPGSLVPLIAGIALTLGFAAAVPVLGFITASFFYVALFMYIAGIRNHVLIWLVALGGVLAFSFVFLKLVYVSIPRGTPPFDQVTQTVMDLLLIK
jgi:cell division protein FtsW (lipid II flippase)